MAIIKWDNSFSVNIAEIDRQHQKLVALINELDDAMRQGKGKEVVSKVVSGLIAYTQTHFGTEERIFAQHGYPEADVHKKEHEDFVAKAAQFQADYNSGKIGLSIQIMNFLSNWLQHHIKVVDKKYGPFLNSKGVK
ncbi:MAG TPA: bacteriohemerythrin [Candidatus Hydrogenedentes bacterium]|nr:bacteriohemerythrin [Candidatus Hydrogenedentota bacterium]HOL77622.1 bacteriohemerythrin [Candidatus Hydrogenedentota bacterium]HPO86747.1 bacteriohemerythrin [Candidatus Hydrogenedentota bacterium]